MRLQLPSRSRAAEPDAFRSFRDGAAAPLTGTLRGSALAFTRVGFGRSHGRLHVEMPRLDAFYVIYQLRDHPPHEYAAEGRAQLTPGSPKGSLHIADMSTAPSAILDSPFDSLNLVVTRGLLDELALDAGAPAIGGLRVPEAWRTRDPVLSRLEPLLVAALDERDSMSRLFVDHVAVATGLHLAEQYGGLRPAVLRPGALAPWQERRAREIIADNLAKELSLAEVAAECGLSLSHFSKAFKASVGMTPHTWLQAARVEKARGLLKTRNAALADIATACGFADQSHFTRIFKRATGATPGVWRRARLG